MHMTSANCSDFYRVAASHNLMLVLRFSLFLGNPSLHSLRMFDMHFALILLRPKMNCGVGLVNCFFVSSPSLPWQHGRRQQGWYIRGTLKKQFTKPTPQLILGRSRAPPKRPKTVVLGKMQKLHHLKQISEMNNPAGVIFTSIA